MSRRVGRMAAVLTAGGMAAVLTACGGGSAGAGGKLDPAKLVKLGDQVAAEPTRDCPVGYDLDKAGRAAGLPGKAAPAAGKDAVSADTEKGADPQSPVVTTHGVFLYCDYTLGSQPVDLVTVATRKKDPRLGTNQALAVLLPLVQNRAHLSSAQLDTYAKQGLAAKPGTVVVSPTRNVAVVALPAKSGHLELMVDLVDDGSGHFTTPAKSVERFAKELADQANW